MQKPFCLLPVVFWNLLLLHPAMSLGNEPIRFERDVRPILSDKCFHCHGPDQEHREADLRLDIEESARHSFVAGDAEGSELISRIFSDDADEIMPPPDAKKPLSEEEKVILQQWIDGGANWTQHWSFVPPTSPTTPFNTQGSDQDWCKNPIDAFVSQGLLAAGVSPNKPADKNTLIRRVTYDLTGLPPTLQEIDDFLNDESEGAYESLVERLLASKHYGERMAVMWLDAARYGDTSVYHADGPRDMWAWRDAVVRAYNDNMPFDRFSIAQLAADYLPDPTLDEQILGGFNRNNGTTDEGGAFAEEYRVEYCVDRVKTTSTIWMGLTMECAQCHDHKYDPISQEEYYQFYAFFNVSADTGMQTRKGNAEPTLAVPDPEKERKLPSVEKELFRAKGKLAKLETDSQVAFEAWRITQENELDDPTSLAQGRILDLDFSEGKGKRIADLVTSDVGASKPALRPLLEQPLAYRRVGTIQGKAEWVNTPLDKGLKFSGNNFVDIGDVADFERGQSFSFGGWVRPQKGIGAMLARMDDGNAYRGYDLYVGVSGVSVHLIHDWPTNAIKVTTKKKLKANEWFHVFATYDGSSKADGIKIFVNGEEWKWKIEQNGLQNSIHTRKSFLVGSRHPGSRFNGEIDSVQVFDRRLLPEEVANLAGQNSIRAILAIPDKDRTESQRNKLRAHFLAETSKDYRSLSKDIQNLENQVADLKKPLTTVMVMRDMENPRTTFILNRGAYDSPTETKVEANTLAALPPIPSDLPRNRYGLAQWLFSAEQPLTARVTVNRYWQMFFGTGLVDTPQDFGSQGSFPSNPELLDWLAVDFRQHGWNVKRTIKQILMSATYRQSSKSSPTVYRRDPANRTLARGPRFRLQAEFIRDSSLAVSGLLNYELGGPGVKPYQPPGLWVEVGLSGKPAFKQDHGDKLYRRSIYTYWKRSAPPPTMQIFDAPTREKCTLQRPRTNTPLQALVVLNDPQYVEAARNFAERILENEGHSEVDKLQFGFRCVTARLPSEAELQVLKDILGEATNKFANDAPSAEKLLAVGESKRDGKIDPTVHASWTIVASTLLNLDETLTRE